MRPPPRSAKGRPLAGAAPEVRCAQNTYQNVSNPASVQHTVVIRPAGLKWSLRVVPPVDGEDFDRVTDTYKQARGFAGGLRLTRGWQIDAVQPRGSVE